MKLIVGLGNPGRKYFETRHNVGFMAIKRLADDLGIQNVDKDCKALIAKGKINTEKIILAQPLTYMNRSGESIIQLVKKYDIDLKDIIIIYDDLDLPVGKIRIKENGGSAGHKGIKSIIETLDSNEIKRIRIGIGRPLEIDVTEYVLQKFAKEQKLEVKEALKKISLIVKEIIKNGIDEAMNKFN